MLSADYSPILFFPSLSSGRQETPRLCVAVPSRAGAGVWVRGVSGNSTPRGLASAAAAVRLAAAGSGRPLSRRAMFYFHCPPQLEGECCRTETSDYKSSTSRCGVCVCALADGGRKCALTCSRTVGVRMCAEIRWRPIETAKYINRCGFFL